MDPATAVGLAASIITFIEFSHSLIVGSYQLYNSASGLTTENTHISNVIKDLTELTADIRTNQTPRTGRHDKALAKLANQCNDLSVQLTKILEKLRVREGDPPWKSLKAKWSSMRKEKDIAGLEKRLSMYRSQILLRVAFMLGDQNSIVRKQLDDLENHGKVMASENCKQLERIRNEILSAVQDVQEDLRISSLRWGTTSTVPSTVISRTWTETSIDPPRHDYVDVSAVADRLSKLRELASTMPKENRILNCLYFSSMYKREDAITDAEPGTFSWLLEDVTQPQQDEERDPNLPPSQPQKKSSQNLDDETLKLRKITQKSFQAWLQGGNHVFHICGKAGSGKSTLMKFLFSDERLGLKLREWAGEKTLVLAQFYFWRSGDEIQMSLDGLYRSLLVETLKQCPQLIPLVFPDQWKHFSHHTEISVVAEVELFRPRMIEQAFQRLVMLPRYSHHRLCFFVDGLDEYHGDSADHWRLAASLKQWASSNDVKICVSSRPHVEFVKSFESGSDHRLNLHELNRGDIRKFVQSSFGEHVEAVDGTEYEGIVREIVDRAEGVFLWARLSSRSVVSGIRRGDRPTVLMKSLAAVPRELDDLFDKLLATIAPADRQRSSLALLLAATMWHRFAHSTIRYSWLDDLLNPTFPLSLPVARFSREELEKRATLVDQQLASLTGGLLEIRGGNVQFFHRTARDYIVSGERMENIRKGLPLLDGLDECDLHFRLDLAHCRFGPIASSDEEYLHPSNLALTTLDALRFWATSKDHQVRPELIDDFYSILTCIQTEFGASHVFLCPFYHRIGYYVVVPTDDTTEIARVGSPVGANLSAYYGLFSHVKHCLSRDPSLLHATPSLSLLLSAAIGGHEDMVRFLLQNGSSPMEDIDVGVKIYRNMRWILSSNQKVAVWPIFAGFAFRDILFELSEGTPNVTYLTRLKDMVALFLKCGADPHIELKFGDNDLSLTLRQMLVAFGYPATHAIFDYCKQDKDGPMSIRKWLQSLVRGRHAALDLALDEEDGQKIVKEFRRKSLSGIVCESGSLPSGASVRLW